MDERERILRVELAIEQQARDIKELVTQTRANAEDISETTKNVARLMALMESDRRLVKFALGAGAALFTLIQAAVQILLK